MGNLPRNHTLLPKHLSYGIRLVSVYDYHLLSKSQPARCPFSSLHPSAGCEFISNIILHSDYNFLKVLLSAMTGAENKRGATCLDIMLPKLSGPQQSNSFFNI